MASLRRTLLWSAIGLGVAWTAWSQHSDTVIYGGRQTSFTILDQADTPAERARLEVLYNEADPAKKRELALDFIDKHPRSWALTFVYEIASKAAIRLDDFESALRYGRASLRLLPENPTLLVSLANVQIHVDRADEAEGSARDALRYLDRFERPSQFSPQEWDRLETELRSSCYYVLGRVVVQRGLAADAPVRQERFAEARELLLRSRELNAADPSAAYLLGQLDLSLSRPQEAARHLADAYRLGGPLKHKAEAQLKRIFDAAGASPAGGFAGYLASLEPFAAHGRVPPAQKAPAGGKARYVGSQACSGCHREAFGSWEKTGMARMFRPYSEADVLGVFNNAAFLSQAGEEAIARMRSNSGRPYLDVLGNDGAWHPYRVDFTIGSKWQQAYATRLANGEIHVLPIQYSVLLGKWVNFWSVIDPPGTRRADVRRFPELSPATAYQLNCAMCHTSQLTTDPERRRAADFAYREAGVNCEMCHGPSADHVAAMREGKPAGWDAASPPVRFDQINSEQYVSICGRCHMQSNVVDVGRRGEVNFTGDARAFFPGIKSRPYAEFSRKAFHGDGRFRETTFIGESFLRSNCYLKGGAHCGNCHDPHPANAAANPKSLKFLDEPDRACLQCHSGYAARIERHTHHPATSEGSRCVSCHMPKIMHGLLFEARTHRIDDIPDAEMTLRFGQDKSPNACLICHADKDGAWARDLLSAWEESEAAARLRPRPVQNRNFKPN